MYSQPKAREILRTPISVYGSLDRLIWIRQASASFSVKKGCSPLMQNDEAYLKAMGHHENPRLKCLFGGFVGGTYLLDKN